MLERMLVVGCHCFFCFLILVCFLFFGCGCCGCCGGGCCGCCGGGVLDFIFEPMYSSQMLKKME